MERRRGTAHAALGQHAEAFACYSRVRSIAPHDLEVLRAECGLRLRLGDYAAGLPLYEARLRWNGEQAPVPAERLPRWSGREPLAGRGLLVHQEQGYGDSIQFLRYLPMLRERGAKLRVMVPEPLAALVRASFPWAERLAPDAPLPPGIDLQCPLPSLPFACGTTLETIPAQVPYLAIPPGRRVDPRIDGARPRLRVGLAWSGNPAHPGDRQRSIGLVALLEALPAGPAYFSLQPALGQGERALLQAQGVVDLGAGFADFADTAAAMALLDLVVTVDTSVAHLAGALARETWILLPRVADWRWLLAREDSPWYPTVRLFRQAGEGGWPPVLARVRAGLLARDPTNRI